ncbi:hypothetical protein CMK18_16695 [Candidatus Poribacteria bacterium]|nr:hypothetical protein [Candidatus Poribacteria bacterium]
MEIPELKKIYLKRKSLIAYFTIAVTVLYFVEDLSFFDFLNPVFKENKIWSPTLSVNLVFFHIVIDPSLFV